MRGGGGGEGRYMEGGPVHLPHFPGVFLAGGLMRRILGGFELKMLSRPRIRLPAAEHIGRPKRL